MPFFLDSLWLYTMNRCHGARTRVASALLLSFACALGASVPPAALAQQSVRRMVPHDVVLGRMAVTTPPAVQIDGKDARLAPGVRIHDTRNMLVLTGHLAGKTMPVVYKRDARGAVNEVWLLTEDEYKQLGGAGKDAQKFLELLAAVFGGRK